MATGTRKEGERPGWLNADDSYDLMLPVDYREGDTPRLLNRLQLRRLTAADMIVAEAPALPTERQINLLTAITAVPRVVLLKLDAVDLDRIDDCLGYFMEPGSVTGATS